MFFKSSARQSPNPIHYFVSFLSPYFLLYIKCPKIRYWQLARKQDELTKVVDGSAEIQIHPVLLFSSRNEAEEYATAVLGLRPKKMLFRDSELFSLWHNSERFESVTLPEETIHVQKTLCVRPVVHVKETAQVSSVLTLPFVDRRRN
jgi:hypothetical protein